MNLANNKKNDLKYDGLISKFIKKYYYVKTGYTFEDGLQDGRIIAWQAATEFQARCSQSGWDNYGGAEYIFVKNRLVWFFIARQNKSHIKNDILNNNVQNIDDHLYSAEQNSKAWINLELVEKKITDKIKSSPELLVVWGNIVKRIDKVDSSGFSFSMFLDMIGSKDIRIHRKKSEFFNRVLSSVGAEDLDFIKNF